MQTIERSGVQFDMCPTCRGVWLDRGELEKLMGAAAQASRPAAATAAPVTPQPAYQPAPQAWGQPPREPRRDDYGHDPRKRKKRDSIFDIFDFD